MEFPQTGISKKPGAVFMPRFFEDFKDLFDKRMEFVSMLGESERYLTILAIIEIALVALFVGTAPGGTILMTDAVLSIWFFAYLIIGILAPLGIGYFTGKLESTQNANTLVLFSLGSFVLTLIGGFLLRYVILTAGQIVA